MIFPIGDDQVKGGARPIVSYTLILLNFLVFFFQISLTPDQLQQLVFEYGTTPNAILQGQDLMTLFTSMFLHGGWMHLMGNMLFLWIFADNIEAVVGSGLFLLFYLAGGMVASGVHVLVNPGSTVPSIGASGAISAVMGAYLVMFPVSRIKVLILIFFRSIYIPAMVFLGFWIIQQLVSGYYSMGVAAEETGVAWWAHIGGFAFGLLCGWYFRKRYRSDRYVLRA
ncbi:MAG TPA: rhomboid family intramembrane serine protease [Saprospiraceae bacterium]|nr:rhomboid family intramembrane serine protease [Saprospiraceae bacterium]HPG05815.1 rhomboid family intramembrane serine protease [Saprospiraceae bacterium]HRV85780.1 rhomboid family intramembrane serine protease [Saprospiraceae bacterium]